MTLPTRPARPADRRAVLDLALDNRMFAPDELGGLEAAFDDALAAGDGSAGWAVAELDGSVVGAAHWAPEPFSDRLWNLYFVAVDPARHGTGAGTALVDHVEAHLRALGPGQARVLLVDTSSTDQYAGARRFYLARGFVEEARVREFYGEGDDKVTFWKRIA